VPSSQMKRLIEYLRGLQQPGKELSFDDMRRGMEASNAWNSRPPEEVQTTPECLAGVPCEWTQVPDAMRVSESATILHLHGGGFVMGSIDSHRGLVARLALAARIRALAVGYRLSPEHPYPAAAEDVLGVYRCLLDRGYQAEQLFLSGDSAGGGLALATLVRLRDMGLPLPRAVVLLSPWLDLSLSGDSMRSRADEDPMVSPDDLVRMSAAYRGELDPSNPAVSPLFASLEGLPPMVVQVGTAEVLLDDARRLAERARSAGIPVDLQVFPDLVHVFQFFGPFVPEAGEAIEQIGTFVQSHL